MKKILIVLSNVLLLFLIFVCFECYLYCKEKTSTFEQNIKYSFVKKAFNINDFMKNNKIRKPCGLEYTKKPILIYGCSYAYGFGLEEQNTLGNLISEKCKRPVYNFGMPAKGLQHAYYLIKNSDIITPEPEYIFYVFINDHFRRMYKNCQKMDKLKYLKYKNLSGELVQQDCGFDFINRFYVSDSIYNYLYKNIFRNIYSDEIYDLARLYFVSIKREIKLKYPNAKFVVIDYERNNPSLLNNSMINFLKKENIDYLNINKALLYKLNFDSYKNPKDKDFFRHPNAKAWNEVSDYIIKEYNL